jgi:hypothetical protein
MTQSEYNVKRVIEAIASFADIREIKTTSCSSCVNVCLDCIFGVYDSQFPLSFQVDTEHPWLICKGRKFDVNNPDLAEVILRDRAFSFALFVD